MEITKEIETLVALALKEDLGDSGDITVQSTISDRTIITADMVAREDGIVAGTDIAKYVFNTVDPDINVTIKIADGESVKAKDTILRVSGNAQNILQAERTALNFLTHLSGIATETARYVEAVKSTGAEILDTRKTLPGWRLLQKHAVKMGGGKNHRMGLYDMVLIKDNHIAACGGIIAALDKTKATNPGTKIEIEVDTLDQLKEVLDHGTADIVLLDNMRGDTLKQAASLCKGKIITEASGGITFEGIRAIAEAGVDYISIGALTHSVRVFDIGLDIS